MKKVHKLKKILKRKLFKLMLYEHIEYNYAILFSFHHLFFNLPSNLGFAMIVYV